MKIHNHGWSSNLVRAVYIVTSSARMMVRVSSHPVASMWMVVRVGVCTTAAPNLGCPLMSEPLVYTHSSGRKRGVHGMGLGGVVEYENCCVPPFEERLRECVGVLPGFAWVLPCVWGAILR